MGAETVDDYIAQAPEERRHVLERLRDECLDRLTGFDEGMEYEMPSYRRDGIVEVAFASKSRSITLYVGSERVRFRDADEVDWDAVGALLDAAAT